MNIAVGEERKQERRNELNMIDEEKRVHCFEGRREEEEEGEEAKKRGRKHTTTRIITQLTPLQVHRRCSLGLGEGEPKRNNLHCRETPSIPCLSPSGDQ